LLLRRQKERKKEGKKGKGKELKKGGRECSFDFSSTTEYTVVVGLQKKEDDYVEIRERWNRVAREKEKKGKGKKKEKKGKKSFAWWTDTADFRLRTLHAP